MSDTNDRVKETIRKLMAYANDGAASAGEIENAMAHAARLIDKHNIDMADLEADPAQGDAAKVAMGRHYGNTTASRIFLWEGWLANAIVKLYGTVKVYQTHDEIIVREGGIAQVDKNGRRKMGRRFAFYGPDQDAADAGELYTEWNRAIVTMAVLRWGGAYKGDGGMYCEGFVTSILEKVNKATQHRLTTPAASKPKHLPPGVAVPTTTAITIADRNTAIQEAAVEWIKNECGIKLTSTGGKAGASGSNDAHAEGKRDGKAADFRKRTTTPTRMIGNG